MSINDLYNYHKSMFKFMWCILYYYYYGLGMELQPGAAGFQLSNPPVLETVSLLASLNVNT